MDCWKMVGEEPRGRRRGGKKRRRREGRRRRSARLVSFEVPEIALKTFAQPSPSLLLSITSIPSSSDRQHHQNPREHEPAAHKLEGREERRKELS